MFTYVLPLIVILKQSFCALTYHKTV